MDIEDKVFHIKVVDIRRMEEDTIVEFEILDGPLVGKYIKYELATTNKEWK